MRFTFTLSGIKPFSVNALYYSDGRAKTQEYKEWSYQIFSRLANPDIQAGLAPIREYFDHKKHAYIIKVTAYYPVQQYYRRNGGISARTMDLSNWEKPLVDLLFLPKYFDNPVPSGCNNLNIDDRFIISLISKKRVTQATEHSIRISISTVELTSLESYPRRV